MIRRGLSLCKRLGDEGELVVHRLALNADRLRIKCQTEMHGNGSGCRRDITLGAKFEESYANYPLSVRSGHMREIHLCYGYDARSSLFHIGKNSSEEFWVVVWQSQGKLSCLLRAGNWIK